jgi:plasmid stabilization system protein ParE
MRYRLSPLAEEDLREIWLYVADDTSDSAADRLIDAIVERFELLAEQPRMGRSRSELGKACGPYQLRTTSSTIETNRNRSSLASCTGGAISALRGMSETGTQPSDARSADDSGLTLG